MTLDEYIGTLDTIRAFTGGDIPVFIKTPSMDKRPAFPVAVRFEGGRLELWTVYEDYPWQDEDMKRKSGVGFLWCEPVKEERK